MVNTPKFYLISGALDDEDRRHVETSPLAVPESYKRFVIEFGDVQLYRKSSYYLVRVYGVPEEVQAENGELLIHFGRTDHSLAYFKDAELKPDGSEAPVYEWYHEGGLRRQANGFEEWLKKRCTAARRRYKKKEWQAVLNGPVPFSEEEMAVVAARRKYEWRVVRITEDGDFEFEVRNGSTMMLPYLTLGVNRKNGSPFGGIWLPVGHIRPGQSAIVRKDSYKKFVDADELEVVSTPDPGPEDREQYWEFRTD